MEDHKVTTNDGYILGLHRIPLGNNSTGRTHTQRGKPVYILHGWMATSRRFVMLPKESALGNIENVLIFICKI